jgi:hypothetical protein
MINALGAFIGMMIAALWRGCALHGRAGLPQ